MSTSDGILFLRFFYKLIRQHSFLATDLTVNHSPSKRLEGVDTSKLYDFRSLSMSLWKKVMPEKRRRGGLISEANPIHPVHHHLSVISLALRTDYVSAETDCLFLLRT